MENLGSTNVAASVEIIPGVATVQGAMRFASLGDPYATGKKLTDNAVMVGLTYELAQNIELGYNLTSQSGTAWDHVGTAEIGKTASTLLLEVLF